MAGVMAGEDFDALVAQPLHIGVVVHIAALNRKSLRQQDFGNGAHADSANADDVKGTKAIRDVHGQNLYL